MTAPWQIGQSRLSSCPRAARVCTALAEGAATLKDRGAVTHESIIVAVVARWRSAASSGNEPRDGV